MARLKSKRKLLWAVPKAQGPVISWSAAIRAEEGPDGKGLPRQRRAAFRSGNALQKAIFLRIGNSRGTVLEASFA